MMVTVRTALSPPQQILIAVWEHGVAEVMELLALVKRIVTGVQPDPQVASFHNVLRHRERAQTVQIAGR